MSYLQLIRSFLKLLLPFFWKDRKTICSFLGSLLITCLDIVATGWMIFFFKELTNLKEADLYRCCIGLVGGWLICLLIVKIANKVRAILFFGVINTAIRDIREQLLHHLHQTSLTTWGQKHTTSSIINSNRRVSSSVRGFMNIIFIKGLPASLKLFTLGVAMVYVHHAALFFLIPMGFSILVSYFSFRRFLVSRRHAWRVSDQVFLKMKESLYNTRQVRLEKKSNDDAIKKVLDKEASIWWKNNLHEKSIFLLQAIMFWIGIACMTTYIVRGSLSNQWNLVMLFLMKGYAFAIYKSIDFLTRQLRKLFTYMIDLKKIIDVFDIPIEKRDSQPLLQKGIKGSKPLVAFENVSFSFPNSDTPLLENISFSIQKGEKVGIIGLSGMGKSTLCHLLAGLYLPTKGEVVIDAITTGKLNPSRIGQAIHFISQEAMLNKRTVKSSVQDEPYSNATLAALGYLHHAKEKEIGEGSIYISSGEKQRILLAHSLAKKPQAMVLDETLSAIDEESAQAILKEILAKVPTVVLVSHRLSLMSQLDRDFQK